jgi:hypothetical protein
MAAGPAIYLCRSAKRASPLEEKRVRSLSSTLRRNRFFARASQVVYLKKDSRPFSTSKWYFAEPIAAADGGRDVGLALFLVTQRGRCG